MREDILQALSKLIKEKTELKAKKIELGMIDDLKRSLNSLGADSQILLDSFDITRKLFFDIEGATKKAKERTDTNKQILKSSKTKIELAESLLSRIEKAAKELGLSVKDIKEYSKVQKALEIVKDDLKDLIVIDKKLDKII
tara:strand:- start:41 stop:463 length:423 start_codon:yes stop_codon:yes gene_type:complete